MRILHMPWEVFLKTNRIFFGSLSEHWSGQLFRYLNGLEMSAQSSQKDICRKRKCLL